MFLGICKQFERQSPQINMHRLVIISVYKNSYRYCAVDKTLLWAETSWLSRGWSCHKRTGQAIIAVWMWVLKWNVWTEAQNDCVIMRYLRFSWWYQAYSLLGFDTVCTMQLGIKLYGITFQKTNLQRITVIPFYTYIGAFHYRYSRFPQFDFWVYVYMDQRD